MSEMEHNKGRLIPFEMTEAFARELVITKEGEDSLDDCYGTYLEQLSDDITWYSEDLVKIGSNWYTVQFDIKAGELDGFANVVNNEDGSINFETYHYNGGAYWVEVVEGALSDVV